MRWLVALLILGVVGGAVWEAFALAPSAQSQVTLDSLPTVEAKSGTFVVKLTQVGEIQTVRSESITAPFNGKIVYLADEGYVNKGDLLVELDTEDFKTQLRDKQLSYDLSAAQYENKVEDAKLQQLKLQNAVKEAQDRVEMAGADLDQAKKNYERKKVLVEKGLEPKVNLEQAEISLLKAQKSYESAQTDLQEAQKNKETQEKVIQLNLDSARNDLDKKKKDLEEVNEKIAKAKIYAPTSGLVIHYTGWKRGSWGKVQKGDELYPGMTIMNFPDMSEILSIMKVDEVDIQKVEVGQKAEIRLDALPGRVYHGKVVRKGTVAITELSTTRFGISLSTGSGQTKGFQVDVYIDDKDDQLRPGMTTRTDIILEEIPDAVWIPLEALFDRNGEAVVYVKGAGKFKAVPVLTGKRTDTDIQIIQGLKGGETLFLADPTKSLKRYQPKERKKLEQFMPGGGKMPPGGGERRGPPMGRRSSGGRPS